MSDPQQELSWDPVEVASELSAKLASRSRHINVLLGAGSSRPASLPDMKKLTELISADLDGESKALADELFKDYGLEDALSRVRKVRSLLKSGETFGDFTPENSAALDANISRLIVAHLSVEPSSLAAHGDFATWVIGDYYVRPIEIFTTNYDLLVELGLESVGASYADGFVGVLEAGFRSDIVEATGTEFDTYPASFARVWKLHGSLNWKVGKDGQIVRLGGPAAPDELAAIYPSENKYDDSRRVPYTVIQDRFRRALSVPESLTLVCGFGFGDQHLNEIFLDAARRNPRSEFVVLCHGNLNSVVRDAGLANVTVLGAAEGLIGGEVRKWEASGTEPARLFESGRFKLGDFASLAWFLSRSTRAEATTQDVLARTNDEGLK